MRVHNAVETPGSQHKPDTFLYEYYHGPVGTTELVLYRG